MLCHGSEHKVMTSYYVMMIYVVTNPRWQDCVGTQWNAFDVLGVCTTPSSFKWSCSLLLQIHSCRLPYLLFFVICNTGKVVLCVCGGGGGLGRYPLSGLHTQGGNSTHSLNATQNTYFQRYYVVSRLKWSLSYQIRYILAFLTQ